MNKLIKLPKDSEINITEKYNPFDFTEGVNFTFVATYKSDIVGHASLTTSYIDEARTNYWTLRKCVVAPKARGLGIQKKLIEARIDKAVTLGAYSIIAYVTPTNIFSINNLIKCGFLVGDNVLKEFDGAQHICFFKYLKNPYGINEKTAKFLSV